MICNICKGNMNEFAHNLEWIFYKCPYCGFYDTQSDHAITSVNYNDYTTFDANLEMFDSMVDNAVHILKHKFNILGKTPSSFIDIGCSEGVFVKAFNVISTGDVLGIEVSRKKILRAKERGLNVTDYENATGKYEFILLRHVVEHIPNSGDYINSIADRFLAPNGVICIETPNNDHLGAIKRKNTITNGNYCRELYPPSHICGYTAKAFKVFAKRNGFNILKMTSYGESDDWCYPSKGKKDSTKENIRNKMNLSLNLAVFLVRKECDI